MSQKLRCKKCGDIIQSLSVHDFKECKCKSIFVDGGNDYLRYGSELEDIEFIYDDLREINYNDAIRKAQVSLYSQANSVTTIKILTKQIKDLELEFKNLEKAK